MENILSAVFPLRFATRKALEAGKPLLSLVSRSRIVSRALSRESLEDFDPSVGVCEHADLHRFAWERPDVLKGKPVISLARQFWLLVAFQRRIKSRCVIWRAPRFWPEIFVEAPYDAVGVGWTYPEALPSIEPLEGWFGRGSWPAS